MKANRPLLVLYHDDLDGFASAYCAWRKNVDRADYIPVNYGQFPPSNYLDYDFIDILDFSYPRATLEEMAAKHTGNGALLVLDHHKTAEEELKGLPYAVFDGKRSGCAMAWKHYCAGDGEMPEILRAVEDRDLWRFQLHWTREICAALDSRPRNFLDWHLIIANEKNTIDRLFLEGSAILRYIEKLVETHVRHAEKMNWTLEDGSVVTVPIVNATMLQSEIGAKLCAGVPFSATFLVQPDGRKVWSLRSDNDGLDVSAIARLKGGGGHKNAAGFVE